MITSLKPLSSAGIGRFAAVALTIAMASVLGACGTGDETEGDSAAERRVEHAMGTTAVSDSPKRVVVLDTVLLDATLALDVTPVGSAMIINSEEMPKYLGEEASKISSVGEILEPDLEEIANVNPDLILSAKTRHEDLYESLSDIAPTVFVETSGKGWRDSVDLVSEALNREDRAQEVLEDYDSRVAQVKQELGVADETAQVIRPREAGALRLYGPDSFTGDVLTEVGFTIPQQSWDESGIVELSEEKADSAAAKWLFVSDDPSNPEVSDDTIKRMSGEDGEVYSVDHELWIAGVGPLGADALVTEVEKIVADAQN